MSTATRAGRTSHAGHRVRALALVRTEVRLQHRHGGVAGLAAVTVAWLAVLAFLPPATRSGVVPWVLFLDVAAIGVFLAPALAAVERGDGVPPAVALTRSTVGAGLATRVLVMATMSVVASAPLVALGRSPAPVQALGAVVLVSVLASLLGLVALGRSDSLATWMTRLPLVAVPLLLPPLVQGVGLWDARVLALSPFTGTMHLLAGRGTWTDVAWAVVWGSALALVAVRQADAATHPHGREPAAPGTARTPRARRSRRPPARSPVTAGPRSPGGWRAPAVRSILRVDRRTVLGDGTVLALLAGLPILALFVRWLDGAGGAWLAQQHGFDVTPWLPLAWTFVVVVHTPTMLGSVSGLLFCEDRDTHVLPAVALTRASLSLLVGVRVAATALAATLAVAVGLPLAGAHHPAGAVGVLATAIVAGAIAVVPMLAVATLARDRVGAVALVKALALPLYLPLALVAAGPPLDLLSLVVPTGWAVLVAGTADPLALTALTLGGLCWCGVIGVLLGRRLVRTPTS